MTRGAFAPAFLTMETVLEIHETAIAAFGGRSGLIIPELLESAVAMPCQVFDGQFLHTDLFEMAAATPSTSSGTMHLAMETKGRGWGPR